MTRPEDIPADVWGTAVRYAGGEFAYIEVTTAIALAILEERERCGKLAEDSAQPGFTEFVDGYNMACSDISHDIRSGQP